MKRNHYKANRVKKGMKLMAAAALSAVLLAGRGQGNAEDGRDTIADAGGTDATDTQRLEDTAKTAENTDNTEEIYGTENQGVVGVRQQKEEAHSWKPGLGTVGKRL